MSLAERSEAGKGGRPRLLACALLAGAGLASTLAPLPAAACRTNTGCRVQPANGSDPCNADIWSAIGDLSRNALGGRGPDLGDVGQGCTGSGGSVESVPATFPCTLWGAITYAESSWVQFCYGSDGTDSQPACGDPGVTGPTLISFDCGYGLTQVTSGMRAGESSAFDPDRVAGEYAYNLGTGGRILAGKWRATPCVGDNQPTVVEDWFYAVWAYNGFCWCNNPNNPDFAWPRDVYRSPGGLSRGSYPYQEIVWGYMHYPPSDIYPAIPASLPDRSQLCNTSGCSPGRIPDPQPIHRDECQTGTPEVDDAQVIDLAVEPATTVTPGTPIAARFTLQNTGTTTWTAAGSYLLAEDGGDLAGVVPAQVTLGGGDVIGPGATHVFVADFPAPAEPGTYTHAFRMDRFGVARFGERRELSLTVQPASGTDADGDGADASIDCDDADPRVHPGAADDCDGLDLDCDGADVMSAIRPCGCGGIEDCVDGAWTGCPGARIDICDGEDDDCNGLVDDGDGICPEGQSCQGGVCARAGGGGSGGPGGGGGEPAGPSTAPAGEASGSCGCQGASGPFLASLAALILVLAARGRRRR